MEDQLTVDPFGVETYVIAGDFSRTNVASLQRYFIDSVDILSFWNHIPLVFCVKTRLRSPELVERLFPFFNGSPFIVGELNKSNVSGWLPPAAWTWFSTPAPPEKKPGATYWGNHLLSDVEKS